MLSHVEVGRGVWNRLVDGTLDVDEEECLAFLALVDESISERESRMFLEGLKELIFLKLLRSKVMA